MEGYQSVDKWLNRLAPATARVSRTWLGKFMRWLKENGGTYSEYTPDDLVNFQKNADNGERFEVLDLIQRYIGQLTLRASSIKREYAALRSLFAHNRAELPKDPTFRIRSSKASVEGTLTIGEIRDVILSSNKCYRAVFISMFQGGMGLEEIDHWNRTGYQKLREDLRGDPEVITVRLPGRKTRKNIKPFYTLLGRDTIKLLREWMAVRPSGGETIFINQHGDAVSPQSIYSYWARHLVKLGVTTPLKNGDKSNRYGKNPHEMRDVFRSQWEKSPAKGSVAEFMMGHIVDPLFYNKAFRDEDWVREEYLQALPMLEIMSSDTPFGKFDGKTVKKLQGRISELEAIIDEMMPAFKFAQTMFNEKRERDRIQEASREPEDAGAGGV